MRAALYLYADILMVLLPLAVVALIVTAGGAGSIWAWVCLASVATYWYVRRWRV